MAHTGLLSELQLLWRVHQAALLVVHEVVAEAYNDERYVVVARLLDTLKAETFLDNGLSDLTVVVDLVA